MAEEAKQSGRQTLRRWSDIWHLPVLVVGLILFIAGVYAMIPSHKGPQYDLRLKNAAEYLTAHNYKKAEKVLKGLSKDIGKANDHQKGRYWEYWADLNYEQQKMQNPAGYSTDVARQNSQKIIDYYHRAKKLLGSLRTSSLEHEASTLVFLGKVDKALKIVDQLKDTAANQRYAIVRNLINRQRHAPGIAPKDLLPLINRFKQLLAQDTDKARRIKQELWVTRVQARVLLDADDLNGAVDFLLRHIPLVSGEASAVQVAPLFVTLAKAYQRMGQYEDARRFYKQAGKYLPASSTLNADVLVGLGQIELADSNGPDQERKALDLFSQVTQNYPSQQPASLDAKIGEADINFRLNQPVVGLQLVRQAVDTLKRTAPQWPDRKQALLDVVKSHIDHANDTNNYDLALKLLQAARPIEGKPLAAPILLDFAKTHENIARQRLEEAKPPATASANSQPMAIDSASSKPTPSRRLLNQQAAEHFGKAAEYFLKYAQAVTITNDQAYGTALWQAGVDFDKAQRWQDAINVYADYIQNRPDDPRRLKAINHLGKAFLADGQYQKAIEQFSDLVNNHPNSPQAFDSLVPLAQAYIAIGKTEPAKRTLLQVVSDHPSITPSSATYRDALIELGKLYYRMAADNGSYYAKAIERLTEGVKRYGDTPQGPMLRFLLADSYRKSVNGIDKKLKRQQSQNSLALLRQARNQRLTEAQKYYKQVIDELDTHKLDSMSPLEKLYYRNAYFYQADCAYDRGDYRTAISLYRMADKKWQNDPASLIALIQIVNAYCELGEYDRAKANNKQALWQLKHNIPKGAFSKPGMPMTRQVWKDWLKWSDKLNLFTAGSKPS